MSDGAQQNAVDVAVANSRIDSHEKVCAERYGEIKLSFDRVHGRIDWVMRASVTTAISAVGGLLVFVGSTLLKHG